MNEAPTRAMNQIPNWTINDEQPIPNVSEFIACLIELLTRAPENVQISARQLNDFPQWLQLAGNRCLAVRSYRMMQETMIQSRMRAPEPRIRAPEPKMREPIENMNLTDLRNMLEETERNHLIEKRKIEYARVMEEEARLRADDAKVKLDEAREREALAREQNERSKQLEELERIARENRAREEAEQQAREESERRRKMEEHLREQEKQRKIQEEQARLNDPPVISNQPHANFMSFIGPGKPYLKFAKNELPPKLSKKMNDEVIQYPIGVAYDEKAQLWFICDRNTHKMVVFNTKNEFISICDQLTSPTAVMVYEEGRNVAVLCAYKNMHTIYTYDYTNAKPAIKPIIAHHEDIYDMKYKLRGLAKSVGSNIISMETNTIRVFKKRVGGKVFEMSDTKNPCFLATFKTLVAVSDVISNKVFIFSLDDRNWDAVTFNKLKVIGSDMEIPIYRLSEVSGFKFVSGIQFDASGNLMVADSKGHSIKLYDREFKFVHRVSSCFPLPYVSMFHISKEGECMLLDTKDPKIKLQRMRLTSGHAQLPWVRPEYWGSKDADAKKK